MATHVLDASAVIALMGREPGGDRVRELIRSGGAGISTDNVSEVAAKLVARGADPATAERQCRSLGLEFLEVDARVAFSAAALLPATSVLGLSLGDRICLATAEQHGVPAVTANRAWARVAGAVVEWIR
jgi:PIN domain nuclease of toxin-antitoxin system